MRICYLLESTELSGGVRVVLDQALALAARGHDARVFTLRGDAGWHPGGLPVRQVADLAAAARAWRPDVVVATFWTTVESALAAGAPLAVHLCQGLEFECPEYAEIGARIEAAYRAPLGKLTVGPWLDEKLRARFGAAAFAVACVGQCVDTALYRPVPRWRRWLTERGGRRPLRVLVPGMFESAVKGIGDALAALALLRAEGMAMHVSRVSPLPQNPQEASVTTIDAYHAAVSPREMARLYRAADVVLTPSRDGEGFGLPFAEALACGRAVAATRITPYLSLDDAQDYALLVPVGDVPALAAAVRQLGESPALRERLGRRGAVLVRRNYAAGEVAKRLETTLTNWLAHG